MTNTRKIVIGMHAGMAGTNAWEFWIVPETMTEEELCDFAWERGIDHADSYGIYPREEYSDTEDYNDEANCYSDNIEGWYEDYVPEKHDGHSMSGTPSWSTY
jgi:hypothetical protein